MKFAFGTQCNCVCFLLFRCFYQSMQVLWPFIWSFTPGQPLSMAQLQHLNQEPRWSSKFIDWLLCIINTTSLPVQNDNHSLYFSIACACFSFHYIKRLLETVFIHRFSNATMPISNLFKVIIMSLDCMYTKDRLTDFYP